MAFSEPNKLYTMRFLITHSLSFNSQKFFGTSLVSPPKKKVKEKVHNKAKEIAVWGFRGR